MSPPAPMPAQEAESDYLTSRSFSEEEHDSDASDDSADSFCSAYTSPAAYDLANSSELDELIQSWTLEDAYHPQPATSSRQDNETLYAVGAHGVTKDWSDAAGKQKAGEYVQAIQRRKKVQKNPACAVVTVGKPPGLCTVAQAMQRVKNVKRSVWQTYSSEKIATQAWRAAQEKGLVGDTDGHPPRRMHLQVLDHKGGAPPPSALADDPITYYNVYSGRKPGIYDSA
ncbi:hypothetical protein CYLTODRAFT_447486 [Cylindrobasidium torrendii FP15055 ss-10]|uniref:Uncharacterized protein n=1 Tax=Cylindrobasidium torrendii FP15055 ss-10 TaxID=1314674 RepID=A0A0D7AX84_9AGAR|nr:hypothetical protein CYLTODRAFT_447486 [Cylindrobasidium torrendii FP15055 ss-10]